jgi:hypothetical protein
MRNPIWAKGAELNIPASMTFGFSPRLFTLKFGGWCDKFSYGHLYFQYHVTVLFKLPTKHEARDANTIEMKNALNIAIPY